MKRLRIALSAFYRVLRAKEYCIITVQGTDWYYINSDISLQNFKIIANDAIDDTMGTVAALNEAKELLK